MEPGGVGLLVLIGAVSFILSFVGSAVGLVLGHMRLPLLIAYLGSPGSAALTNLLISGCGAFGGATRHLRDGRIDRKVFLLMGIPSIVGAVLAIKLAATISPVWSFTVIGIVLIVSAVAMIRPIPAAAEGDPLPRCRRLAVEIGFGLLFGALAAITGLMLGSLRLPVMLRYLRMDLQTAVGTNMAVGFLIAVVGGITALFLGTANINVPVMAFVMPATFLGGYLGGWLTGRVNKGLVRRVAGGIIGATGVILLVQAVEIAGRKTISTVPVLRHEESGGDDDYEFELTVEEDDEAATP